MLASFVRADIICDRGSIKVTAVKYTPPSRIRPSGNERPVKRYELANYRTDNVAEWIETFQASIFNEGFPPGGIRIAFRKHDLRARLGLITLHHFQFDFEFDVLNFLELSSAVAVEYFCGNWWAGDEDSKIHMDKRTANKTRDWSGSFADSVLLLLLADDRAGLSTVCEWPEADLPPYPTGFGNDTPDEVVSIYLLLANSLRSTPMRDAGKLHDSLRKTRKKEPRLLYRIWRAIEDGHQLEYEGEFRKAVSAFIGKEKQHDYPLDYISPTLSVLAAGRVAGPESRAPTLL